MINFTSDQIGLVLQYRSDTDDGQWVQNELTAQGEATLSRVFTLQSGDLLGPATVHPVIGGLEFEFRFAVRSAGYFQIPGRVLNVPNDVLIADSGVKIERKLFVAERNVSVFRRIAGVVGPGRDIVVGGDREDAIPLVDFQNLLKKFPNTTELDQYANARVATLVGDFFVGMKDFRGRYEAYLDRRASISASDLPDLDTLLRTEIEKYVFIRDTIAQWLVADMVRPEKDWQEMILKFILLIFPKYVAVLQNVTIADHYSNPTRVTHRFLDIALIDANGNLDVIEIKRPFDDILLSKAPYRGNYVPTKELSGTIMQAEKYLFHLSKWGIAGEKALTAKYGSDLPPGMTIRITNPRALVILGRDRKPDGAEALDASQTFDLELIKRKYAKLLDIITYDDLIRRLNAIIAALEKRIAAPSA